MRSISEDEITLLQAMIWNPDCISLYNDLTTHHFLSDYGWSIYEACVNSDLWDKEEIAFKIRELSNKKIITHAEFINILPDGIQQEHWVDVAYKNIKEVKNHNKINTMLENIDFNNLNTSEIKEKLAEIINIEEEKEIKFETLEEISNLDRNISLANLKFDIQDLDDILEVEKNHLIILGARPFNGKTTLGIKFAMANTKGKKVLFISMEMNKIQIADMARSYGGFYHKGNLYVVERTKIKLNEIERLIKKSKACLIVIDQLNKIDVGNGTIYEMFTQRAQGLKLITSKYKVPIICLAQASRDSENAKQLQIHHLKGSGSIEEEADIIMLLERDESNKSNSTLRIAKNRSGKGRLFQTYLTYDENSRLIKEL